MRPHSEQTTLALVGGSEPGDGTRLVVEASSGAGGTEWKVIFRDDAEARRWDSHEDDHWFDRFNDEPMGLHQHLRYARAVYRLGEQIGAAPDTTIDRAVSA